MQIWLFPIKTHGFFDCNLTSINKLIDEGHGMRLEIAEFLQNDLAKHWTKVTSNKIKKSY
ncbi:MAG: hypothetical protein WAT16_01455 [Saprospiraceae bacterium]